MTAEGFFERLGFGNASRSNPPIPFTDGLLARAVSTELAAVTVVLGESAFFGEGELLPAVNDEPGSGGRGRSAMFFESEP